MTVDQQAVNVELLQRALDHITANPDEHDQGSWGYRGPACGTRFCLAGHAVNLSASYRLAWVDDGDGQYNLTGAVPAHTTAGEVVLTEEEELYDYVGHRSVSGAADTVLGLDADYHGLYGGNVSLHELWYRLNELTGGKLRVPVEYRDAPDDEDDDR